MRHAQRLPRPSCSIHDDQQLLDISCKLRRFFVRHTKGEHEDLVQETLLRYWCSKGSCRLEATPEAFIFGIATNVLKQHYRSKKVRARITYADPALLELVDAHESVDLDAAILLKAPLQRLASQQRALLHSLYWCGYTADEAAKMLARPSASLRRQHHETKRLLRHRITQGSR